MEEPKDLVQESFDRVLTGMTKLIISMVRSGHAGRFEEAKRLCDIAQSLVQSKGRLTPKSEVVAPAVQDQNVMPHEDAVGIRVGNNYLVDTPHPPHRRLAGQGQVLFDNQGRLVDENGVAYTGPLDAHALMRHMLVAFGPNAQTGAEANRARVAAEEAAELKALVDITEHASRHLTPGIVPAALTNRVQQLMSNMEIRSNASAPPDPQEAPVVPPDDQRGHQADEGGPEADDPPRLRVNAVGNAGNGGAPREGALHQVGEAAVV